MAAPIDIYGTCMQPAGNRFRRAEFKRQPVPQIVTQRAAPNCSRYGFV